MYSVHLYECNQSVAWALIRDGDADMFCDAHRCRYTHYPTYVGYSAILSDNAEVDADIRIRMAIPSQDPSEPKMRASSLIILWI